MYIWQLMMMCFIALNIIQPQAVADPSNTGPGGSVVCPMDAKLCPDGSGVGRVGPNCEFAPCPGSAPVTSGTSKSFQEGITGRVTLGPRCPVVSYPEPDNCKDRPYQASLVATVQDTSSSPVYFSSDQQGRFKIDLPPGAYVITSKEMGLPRCRGEAKVWPGKYDNITVYCDTGIR